MSTQYTGLDDLRAWLIASGFNVAYSLLHNGDECNWYAYRRSALQAVACECNDDKAMQIVVYPYVSLRHERIWESG
jgi:hypothetical protein